MNGKKVVSTVMPVIKPIVEDLGFTLVDVEYKKTVAGMVLEVFIDSSNGIKIEDCEAVSRAIDEPLDVLNPTDNVPYNLNVSSLGLDRPLSTEYEFLKYKDNLIDLKFYQPIKPQNVKKITGTLISWTDLNVTVIFNNETEPTVIEKKQIAQIVPHINF